MAERKVIWAARANTELAEILTYFLTRNKNGAYSLKLVSNFEKAVQQIVKNPSIGRPTSKLQVRVLPVKEYLIFYLVQETEIKILSVWDNRQDIKKREV
jgi:toxin YoeB